MSNFGSNDKVKEPRFYLVWVFMLTVLSGGTGTPKLLQGLARLVDQEEISVVVNTGEDMEMSGLYVSPDVDTVMYTLAGVVNEETWYGIRGDTFRLHEELKRQGKPELLRIGDLDRVLKRRRTELLKQGKTLSAAARELCKQLGVRANVLPMSDDRVRTRVHTDVGTMDFHEFWVARRASDRVTAVTFEGAEKAEPAPGVMDAVEKSDAVIIGPSNPVTSVGPILAIPKIRETLVHWGEKVLAVSPIVGGSAVSGPAVVLMRGVGVDANPLGVAKMYAGCISTLVMDTRDAGFSGGVEKLGIRVKTTDVLIPNLAARERLARFVLGALHHSTGTRP